MRALTALGGYRRSRRSTKYWSVFLMRLSTLWSYASLKRHGHNVYIHLSTFLWFKQASEAENLRQKLQAAETLARDAKTLQTKAEEQTAVQTKL